MSTAPATLPEGQASASKEAPKNAFRKLLQRFSPLVIGVLLASCEKPEGASQTPTRDNTSAPLVTVPVESLKTENPFGNITSTELWKGYHKPWLIPVRIHSVAYPVLIPKTKEKGKKAGETAIIPTELKNTEKELQNTWDEKTQTLTIYFPLSGRDLGNNDWRDIRKLIQHYKQSGAKLQRIEIHGHADTFGNDATNTTISNQRIAAVQKEILRQEIDPSEVTIVPSAHGEQDAKGPDGTKDARERRVEIRITDAITQSVAALDPKPNVILIDNSESMGSNLAVLQNYFKHGGNPDTAFYVFDVQGSASNPLEKNTQLMQVVEGDTPLHDSVSGLSSYAISEAQKQGKKPVIAIITDGINTTGKNYITADHTKAIYHLVQVPGYSRNLGLETLVRNSGGKISRVGQ